MAMGDIAMARGVCALVHVCSLGFIVKRLWQPCDSDISLVKITVVATTVVNGALGLTNTDYIPYS